MQVCQGMQARLRNPLHRYHTLRQEMHVLCFCAVQVRQGIEAQLRGL
jgi:hypothetical protein